MSWFNITELPYPDSAVFELLNIVPLCVFQMQGEGKDAYDDNIHYPILLTLTRGPPPPGPHSVKQTLLWLQAPSGDPQAPSGDPQAPSSVCRWSPLSAVYGAHFRKWKRIQWIPQQQTQSHSIRSKMSTFYTQVLHHIATVGNSKGDLIDKYIMCEMVCVCMLFKKSTHVCRS